METQLLAIQARILMATGLIWLAAGILWWNQDPFTVVWRASLGALVAMWVGGHLLRPVMRIIEERLAIEEAERRLAEEQAEAARLAEEQARAAAEAEAAAKNQEAAAATPVAKSAGRAASARR